MTKSKNKKIKNVNSTQLFERKELYKPEEVLNFLPDISLIGTKEIRKIKKDYNGDLIKMGSDRYYTFAKSLYCHHCQIEGVFFYKERALGKNGDSHTTGFHFNLYAIDKNDKEILMTKDHILAKSKGGKNKISNYITMCRPCNEIKGDMDAEEALKLAKEKNNSNFPKH
jgi:5-methylcytosine-specific restriction endonuclease McrA